MIKGDHFNLTSASENPVLTILKATKAPKAAGLYSLFGCFQKDGAKFIAKPIIH